MKEGFSDVNSTWRRSLIERWLVRRQDTEVVVHRQGRISRAFTTYYARAFKFLTSHTGTSREASRIVYFPHKTKQRISSN